VWDEFEVNSVPDVTKNISIVFICDFVTSGFGVPEMSAFSTASFADYLKGRTYHLKVSVI
jgi:hypothetical protein